MGEDPEIGDEPEGVPTLGLETIGEDPEVGDEPNGLEPELGVETMGEEPDPEGVEP